MRIGIDVRTADPRGSGQQRHLWRLGAWAATEGHDVHYLTVRSQRDDVRTPPGTRLHVVDPGSRARLHEVVTGLAPDVLLLNPERSRAYRGMAANVLRPGYGTDQYRQKLRSFRRPMARALRSVWRQAPWTWLERSWERGFYERTDPRALVIAQSRYMREQVIRTYAVPGSDVHVVPNGVDVSEFNPDARLAARDEARRRWRIPENATCLALLAHNFRLKGLPEVVDAIHHLPEAGRPDYLLVAGRGTGPAQRRTVRRLVHSTALGTRVVFAGEVHPALLALGAADAVVHLTWHDSFGFAVLEAMACGLPVLTTPYAGAAELIDDGVSGLVVDPADPTAVGAALTRLAGESERRRLGAEAARVGATMDEPASFRGVLAVMEIAARRARDRRAGDIVTAPPGPPARRPARSRSIDVGGRATTGGSGDRRPTKEIR